MDDCVKGDGVDVSKLEVGGGQLNEVRVRHLLTVNFDNILMQAVRTFDSTNATKYSGTVTIACGPQ